jgi:hypothetical protein
MQAVVSIMLTDESGKSWAMASVPGSEVAGAGLDLITHPGDLQMALPVYKDTSEIITRFNELAGRLSKDHLTPITGKELAPFAVAISRLAEQVKLLEQPPAENPATG